MSKWKATVRGTLSFERKITVFAPDEDSAGEIANEMSQSSAQGDDELDIESIVIEEYREKEYEVGVKLL